MDRSPDPLKMVTLGSGSRDSSLRPSARSKGPRSRKNVLKLGLNDFDVFLASSDLTSAIGNVPADDVQDFGQSLGAPTRQELVDVEHCECEADQTEQCGYRK